MGESFADKIKEIKSSQEEQVLLPSPKSISSTKKTSSEKNYIKLNDDDKLSYIEKELLHTIDKIDESLDALDMYERETNKIPHGIYDLKNKFLENRRQTLKHLFEIISHKQKLEKEDKGDNFTEIVKI